MSEQGASQNDEAGELPDNHQACSDRGCLLQTSPSVLLMTRTIGALCASFPAQMLAAMKALIENPAFAIHYHAEHDAYTTICQLQQLSRQVLYQFSLPLGGRDDFAFVQFDPRLSALLTTICFGGSIADELSLPTPGTADRPTFSRIGKQLLDQLAQTLAEAWRELCAQNIATTASESTRSEPVQWLGATGVLPFNDDCLKARFDLNIHDPLNTAVQTTIPICFYTPINAFTQAMVQADAQTMTDGTRERIASFLGQIDITAFVDLAPLTLSLDRLRRLKTGDILPISDPNQAVMHVANRTLFLGTTGQRAGYLTLQIDNYGGQVSE